MPSPQKPVVRIAPNNQVFDLPVIVGIEEGLVRPGRSRRLVLGDAMPTARKTPSARPIMSRLKEQLFDCGTADSYNVCEWASIDRLERGNRGGNIAALRAAVAAQAILSFDDALQVPRDLADVPVVVQELTGSHYTTLQMLESAVGAEHVKIEDGGLPQTRWAGLKNRTLSRDRGDGAVHQPRPQGRRAHHRGVVLSRRRGDRAPISRRSSAKPITMPRTRRSISSTPISTSMLTTSPPTPRARSLRTNCCAPSSATSTSIITTRRCSAVPMTG